MYIEITIKVKIRRCNKQIERYHLMKNIKICFNRSIMTSPG